MIQGEIHILPLSDLVQWLALNQRSGSLKVTRENYSIEIFFAKGEIAAAAASNHPVLDNPEKVMGAFNAVLKWPVGRFAFDECALPLWVSVVNLRLAADAILRRATGPLVQPPVAARLDEVATVGHSAGLLNPAETLRFKIMDHIMREDFNLPAMPPLAARVLELTRQPNYSLRDLGNAILADQAVAARILRYANSARQRAEREIVSLAAALQRLGADEVVNIVLAASLQARRLGRDVFAEDKRRLWLHSATAAFVARALAAQLRLERNVAFLCGLMMDFGMNVLYSVIQDILIRDARSGPFPTLMIQQVVQDFHPSIGRLVGEKWQLPATVIQAMAYHHCVEGLETENPYIPITTLADYLADFALGMPRAALEEALLTFSPEQLAAHPAAQRLGLDAAAAASLLANLAVIVEQAHELAAN
ncbi:MAG: HDOD domain-containing protein [Acidobacteria bacterium]|nr:HDOD domain-containing protein [Acidobacteriota bacterium]